MIEFPEKLEFLFKPSRYKGARGGRGSGKSWGFARALLVKGASGTLRVLCAREVQKSIQQSVHQLLEDQIEAMGLSHFYEVQQTVIKGKNGTEFYFSGLSDQTADSLKSFEGVDIVWVEEAQSVSKRSWDILIPTIRKDGSEVWLTYNPQLESDETHQRFVINPPPDCVMVEMNYNDNPYFPAVLEAERQHAQKTMKPEDYGHIWEGRCKPAVEGAIYFDEVADAERDGRICNVPYDPKLKVHLVFDLGWNDAMSISLVQKSASSIAIIENIEDSHKTLSHYSAELKKKNYNWGVLYLPHDGTHKDYRTGMSAQDILKGFGWEVTITPNISIEEGIRLTRMTFPRMYFDKTKCERLIQCAKRYRRAVNRSTNEPSGPLHDEWSHGADNLRYISVNAELMTNEDWGKLPPLIENQPSEDGIYF